MGNEGMGSPHKQQGKNKTEKDPKIGIQFSCPSCQKYFPPRSKQSEVHAHINTCIKQRYYQQEQEQRRKELVREMQPSKQEEIVFNYSIQEYAYVKVPVDEHCTKYKWEKQPIQQPQAGLMDMGPNQVRNLHFQQKAMWLRRHLERRRISWMEGAGFLDIERDNILISSLVEVKKVNMYKEVKVRFIGDKVNDAGGLLREWMRLVIAEMFDLSTGIFQLCNTPDTTYRLKWDQEVDEVFTAELLTLYGVLLGKAIFQKIPVTSYLDRTLLRQIACPNSSPQIGDIFGYDSQLYKNWTFMLENSIDDLCLDTYFTISKENSETETVDIIELVEGGGAIEVTDENKGMFVELSMQMMCRDKVERSVGHIRRGLERVIPEGMLSVFDPYQMEMLLYGVPYIDMQDWRMNTQYRGGFSQQHPVILWFWETMSNFDQQQLARVLKFSTGSSRTPIEGFRLQSNRGNVAKFLIESGPYDKANPYPKGHTCFNRLEIPIYPTKELLKTYLTAIANNDLDGIFGLD